MDERAGLLIVLFLALGVHGAVSLMNAVLQSVSRQTMRERADDDDSAAQRFLALTEDALSLNMTVSITHLLTRFVIAVALILLLSAALNAAEPLAGLLLLVATVLLGTGVTLVIGDLVPEALGSAYADGLLPLSIAPMRLLLVVVSPLTALVLLTSRLISRLFGGDSLANLVTEEEIVTLVHRGHSGGIIEDEEKDMIVSVLQLGESTARELMTPRIDIVALAVSDGIMDAISAFVESGFSRIPFMKRASTM